jgi:Ca2+-binding EF-hand superfamily protein
VNDIVKQVDANGDGQISFEEFAQMMKKLSS